VVHAKKEGRENKGERRWSMLKKKGRENKGGV
jgi:hypothetical protein